MPVKPAQCRVVQRQPPTPSAVPCGYDRCAVRRRWSSTATDGGMHVATRKGLMHTCTGVISHMLLHVRLFAPLHSIRPVGSLCRVRRPQTRANPKRPESICTRPPQGSLHCACATAETNPHVGERRRYVERVSRARATGSTSSVLITSPIREQAANGGETMEPLNRALDALCTVDHSSWQALSGDIPCACVAREHVSPR